MMLALLALTFSVTVLTGPSFDDLRARLRGDPDHPRCRVVYLPSSRCRPRSFDVE